MKRDFSTLIRTLKNEPVKADVTAAIMFKAFDDALAKVCPDLRDQVISEVNATTVPDLTLGEACGHALLAPVQNEVLKPGEPLKRLKLAQRIVDGGVVDISSNDLVLLKDRAAKVFPGSLISGRVEEILEASDSSTD